jgi:GNAT superfamily N-acetyltransferase
MHLFYVMGRGSASGLLLTIIRSSYNVSSRQDDEVRMPQKRNADQLPVAQPGPGLTLEFRHYGPGDEARIIELFERTFGRTMGREESAGHWEWEYLRNPSGKQAILLAFAGETLAAQYAVLPLRVQVDGREMDGALSLDTATDAAFRGRGLMPKLAEQLYAELAEQGYVAVFGFPNVLSTPIIFGKLRWQELAPFPLLLKPLSGAVRRKLGERGGAWKPLAILAEGVWAAWRPRPRRLPSGLEAVEVRRFPDDTDEFWQRASPGKRFIVVRDRRYLDWRYADNPEHLYHLWTLREQGRLVGTMVTRVEPRFGLQTGFILDVLCEESAPEVAAALVGLAERTMVEEGAQVLSCLMYPGTVVHRALRAAGFLSVPRRFFPQEIHFGYRRLAPTVDPSLLSEPMSWYLTWGDSDVV